MPTLTPVDHDPFSQGPVSKTGVAIPPDVINQPITDYPAVQQGASVAGHALLDPVLSVGRVATGQAQDEDYFNAIGALAPEIKGAALAAKPLLSIFGGVMAKTADREALSMAQKMLQVGATKEDIWSKTGWFQGLDNKWRFEIPDESASLYGGKQYQLGGKIKHTDLFAAYPDLTKVEMGYNARPRTASFKKSFVGDSGHEHPDYIQVPKEMGGQSPRPEEERLTLLHEIQHAVQEREGFARGGNPSMLKKYAEEALRKQGGYNTGTKPPQGEIDALAYEAYQRLAGEVESRNVEFRAAYPRNRNRPPWKTEDRPADKQTVIGAKLVPVDHDPFKGSP